MAIKRQIKHYTALLEHYLAQKLSDNIADSANYLLMSEKIRTFAEEN